jgi:hypothetical protein
MGIWSKEDWWREVTIILPELPMYANCFNIEFDIETAYLHLLNNDHVSLFKQLYTLWNDLPDKPEIYCPVFYELSDICSEYWVLSAK